ncbi:repressor of RNA polymerase III transcription [Babesia ovata]|uniref:Repressor of RNA polymerase III transcription n=1 Tax=Babesia ovata TaxID=189622 RepID=A0A2H6KES5_9APIC|nr:repressor of RNA polymerase III transcription [Babesia ovata]GBE61487.1 repressor of RNA polymerase III transcription [Babesia ovata]
MTLVENSDLSRLTALLDRFDASDRVFDVKLELLAFPAKKLEAAGRQHPHAEYFSYIMNHCFPDYSFRYGCCLPLSNLRSHLGAKHFKQVKNLAGVINNIDYNLSFIVERFVPGFAKDFWDVIKDIVPLKEVDIYTYDYYGEDGPFNEGSCMQSFNYFLLDKRQQLVLFLCCVTTGKCDSVRQMQDEQSFTTPCYQETVSSCNEGDCLSDFEVPETMT